MPQQKQKPLSDAELEAFEDSMDFDALLLQSAGEMAAGKTHVVYAPAVEARNNLGLSQEGFAKVLNVSQRTLQQWEQGRRKPSGAARTLVEMALKVPEAFLTAGFIKDVGVIHERVKYRVPKVIIADTVKAYEAVKVTVKVIGPDGKEVKGFNPPLKAAARSTLERVMARGKFVGPDDDDAHAIRGPRVTAQPSRAAPKKGARA